MNIQQELDELITNCTQKIQDNERFMRERQREMDEFYERSRRMSEEVTKIMTRPLREFIEEIKTYERP